MVNRLKNALWLIVGAVVALWAVTSLVGLVRAGDMDPPGPPGGTMKTLIAVEPRTPIWQPGPGDFPIIIDRPGSYYLIENINGEAGKDGIEIAADNVTLDLNGFALIGVPGSLDGVTVRMSAPNYRNLSIYNGAVSGWGGDGIELGLAIGTQVERLRVYLNEANGVDAGEQATLAYVVAQNNGGWGISVDAGVISHSVAAFNDGDGIVGSYQATVRDCLARYNGGDGIQVGQESLVLNNNSLKNDYDNNNDGAGIHVIDANSRIEGNNLTDNHTGIAVDSGGNIIIKNSWRANTVGYSFALNNTYGEIILGPGEIAADPWANFSY